MSRLLWTAEFVVDNMTTHTVMLLTSSRSKTHSQSFDLNDEEEKRLVQGVFEGAIDCLSEEDRKLPQAGWAGGGVSCARQAAL